MSLTRRGRIVAALGLLVLFAGALAGGSYVYLTSLGLAGASDPGRRVDVDIPRGATATEIGERLEDSGVVRSALGFRLATYLEGGAEDIQAGEYVLRRGLSARDALAALGRGPVVEVVPVTFPEGSWLADFARIAAQETHLSRRQFLSATRSGGVRSELQPSSVESLEGLLFPSTYEVDEDATERRLVRRLVEEMERRVSGLDLSGVRARGYTPYDAVVVASMIEAEARVPADRAKISAVIYNRLAAGMRLGIDATVAYAVGRRGGELSAEDLAVDSPFNTRLYAGLPPTPIGAPGLASLRAAARPADGDWLYFVLATCRGRHAFSTDYGDFLEDKAAYRELEC